MPRTNSFAKTVLLCFMVNTSNGKNIQKQTKNKHKIVRLRNEEDWSVFCRVLDDHDGDEHLSPVVVVMKAPVQKTDFKWC
ncbi:hypothetical protein ElyMa_003847600 [Elysia marginata]|uniref:Uncharacterized protein n=1 Tax=Elysia marginata TaxID=1093978 RepID=A0AAV4FH01_9GAST|nr:hypothetical protein ElyMa_003847600 [Elysia marginata]